MADADGRRRTTARIPIIGENTWRGEGVVTSGTLSSSIETRIDLQDDSSNQKLEHRRGNKVRRSSYAWDARDKALLEAHK